MPGMWLAKLDRRLANGSPPAVGTWVTNRIGLEMALATRGAALAWRGDCACGAGADAAVAWGGVSPASSACCGTGPQPARASARPARTGRTEARNRSLMGEVPPGRKRYGLRERKVLSRLPCTRPAWHCRPGPRHQDVALWPPIARPSP